MSATPHVRVSADTPLQAQPTQARTPEVQAAIDAILPAFAAVVRCGMETDAAEDTTRLVMRGPASTGAQHKEAAASPCQEIAAASQPLTITH